MAKQEYIEFMGYQWMQVDDGSIIIGITDEGLSEFSGIKRIHLPSENEEVGADEVCGELDTDDGPVNIYAPIEGRVMEVNTAVIENPDLLTEDPFGDGWLLRISPSDESDLEDLEHLSDASSDDDEDEDDDDFDEDDDFDFDEDEEDDSDLDDDDFELDEDEDEDDYDDSDGDDEDEPRGRGGRSSSKKAPGSTRRRN